MNHIIFYLKASLSSTAKLSTKIYIPFIIKQKHQEIDTRFLKIQKMIASLNITLLA